MAVAQTRDQQAYIDLRNVAVVEQANAEIADLLDIKDRWTTDLHRECDWIQFYDDRGYLTLANQHLTTAATINAQLDIIDAKLRTLRRIAKGPKG